MTLQLQSQAAATWFAALVHERRATAHFSSETVPTAVLTSILRDAACAPSGFNLQPWRFVVVRDPMNRRLLQAAARNQEKVGEAPVVIVAHAPHHEWRERLDDVFAEAVERGALPPEGLERRKRQAEGFVDSLPLPVWLNRHVMIAFTYLMLSAQAHGLDTAPLEGFDGDKVKKVCGLPLETEIVALIAVGKAAEPRAVSPGRFRLDQIAFAENPQAPWPG